MRVIDNYNNTTLTAFATINDNEVFNESVTSLSSGTNHSCTALLSGVVKCWGDNSFGQLGIDQPSDSYSILPVEVANLANAVQVTTAGNHSCAMLANNEIWCWGRNDKGQLGHSGSSSFQPVKFSGNIQPIAVDAGGNSTCALTDDNNIYCWGEYGTSYSKVPGINNAVSITIGDEIGCALTSGGRIICFNKRSDPVVDMGIENAVSVSAGSDYACAVLQTGELRCWGTNDYDLLGNSSFTGYAFVVPLTVDTIDTAQSVNLSRFHACALLDDKTIKCWGNNETGQLGNGLTENSPTPVDVAAINNAIAIGTSRFGATCALLQTGSIKCWGNNELGLLGNGNPVNSLIPVDVMGINNATAISMDEHHSCALLDTGKIKCWGFNYYGQLGTGDLTDSLLPVEVFGIDNAVAIDVGRGNTCATLDTGTVKCWGRNDTSQLGNGTRVNSSIPIDVVGVSNAATVHTDFRHSCALLNDGAMKCWGFNYFGTIGNGQAWRRVPTEVIGLF